MSTPPRRRRPDSRSSKSDGGGWLPTIAMGLGVVVAGLGIGALVAVLMQRTSPNPGQPAKPVALVSSPPAAPAPPTRPPLAIATIVAARTPRPSASPSPEPSPPSTEPSSSPSPEGSPSPSVAPSFAPTAAPSIAIRRPSAPPARPTSPAERGGAGIAVAVPLAKPTPVQLAAATAAPTVHLSAPETTAPVTGTAPGPTPLPERTTALTAQSLSAYDEHASAVVRRYLAALIHGDPKTAYDFLGGSGGTLSEQAFLDPSAHIVSLKVTRIDASNASVGCEIASAKGHYYATYHVTAATNGPYISEHDYIKV